MSRRRFPPPVLLSSFSSFPRKLLKRAIKGNKGRRGENFSSPSQIFCGKRKNRGTTWRMGMASKRNTTCPRGISILREIGERAYFPAKSCYNTPLLILLPKKHSIFPNLASTITFLNRHGIAPSTFCRGRRMRSKNFKSKNLPTKKLPQKILVKKTYNISFLGNIFLGGARRWSMSGPAYAQWLRMSWLS